MTLQFWLLIKYRCCRRRPETQGPSIHIQSESKNHKRKSWHLLWRLCVCVCVCVCWCAFGKHVAYISDHTQRCMCTFTGVREADSRKALRRCCMACWDADSPAACLLLLSLTRWWGFSSFSISVSLSLCCSSRRGQRAVIKLCLHPSSLSLSFSLSHQLEGFSSRVPQIHRPPPSSQPVQRLLPLHCGARLTPSGLKW